MNRNELLMVGLGGGGSRLVDEILNQDSMFQGFFVNTSITDLQVLENANAITKNYLCISTQNGVGRNRNIGKEFASVSGSAIIDTIEKYQQQTIYLVASLGGGSGSAILSVLLKGINALRSEGYFNNKIINIIGILPDLKSPDVILSNTLETWNEIIDNPCINSMIFIDNNVYSDIMKSSNEKEEAVNQKFAQLFDSVFYIPEKNGINFDNGNLRNILTDKGCLYIYELESSENLSIEVAMMRAEQSSVLAKMYKSTENTTLLSDGTKAIKCNYLGISFENKNFNKNYILNNYRYKKESYIGENEDGNLLLISGCYPPVEIVKQINLELDDRKKKNIEVDTVLNFSNFKMNTSFKNDNINNINVESTKVGQSEDIKKDNGTKKKRLRKDLFKM